MLSGQDRMTHKKFWADPECRVAHMQEARLVVYSEGLSVRAPDSWPPGPDSRAKVMPWPYLPAAN